MSWPPSDLMTALLVAANGANDNFKGVATLLGSGTADYRRALAWPTLTTLGGSAVALVFAERLVRAFSGKGLVPEALTAVLVAGASRVGVPVSTTHVSCGALFGLGAATGHARWRAIGGILLAWVTTLPVAALLGAAGYVFLR